MLDAYIIDEIRKQQERQRWEEQRPSLHLPVGPPPGWRPPEQEESEPPKRGVIIIDPDDDPNTIQL